MGVGQHEAEMFGRGGEVVSVQFDRRDGIGQSRRVWLSAQDAAVYVGCKSTRAFYTWRRVKGLMPNGRGFYLRRDLDRAMAIPRKRHVMHPASLANLRKG